MPELGPADLQAFTKALLGRAHIELLVHGNYTEAVAIELATSLEKQLGAAPLTAAERRRNRSLKLPRGTSDDDLGVPGVRLARI